MKDSKQDQRELIDPADREARALDSVLSEEEMANEDIAVVDKTLARQTAEQATAYAPEAAVEQSSETPERLLFASDREKIRVLMISTDRNIFVKGSQVQARMQSYGELFDELHIIVFSLAERMLRPVRIAPNVWVYPTNSARRILYPWNAYMLAKEQLSFSEGFRVDLVSAQDPFEAGLAGYFIARRMRRALQLQLHTDPFERSFRETDPLNKWRVIIAKFLFPRADGIRVVSERLKTEIEKRYKKTAGKIEVLPVFSDLSMWRRADPTFDLHERYSNMKFIILVVSRLTKEKGVDFAIDVCVPILQRYPTVGLVIVGDGPERAQLESKVTDLGIQNQVMFESWQEELASYYKTADLFLNASSYEGYGRTLTEAAAAGLPVLTSDVGIARDLFEDGKTGFVCPVGDGACFTARIGEFLSNNQLRLVFSKSAQDRVFKIITSNIGTYLETFRDGMEQAVVRYQETHGGESTGNV